MRRGTAGGPVEHLANESGAHHAGADAAREKAIMLKITTAGFQASDDRQLLPIRQLELFKDKTKIENDTAMSAADKTAKLEEINRKLAQLNTQLAASK